MYAQLCHQLCEDAPNFEPNSSNITVSETHRLNILCNFVFLLFNIVYMYLCSVYLNMNLFTDIQTTSFKQVPG